MKKGVESAQLRLAPAATGGKMVSFQPLTTDDHSGVRAVRANVRLDGGELLSIRRRRLPQAGRKTFQILVFCSFCEQAVRRLGRFHHF
jgi:hypothetical protein